MQATVEDEHREQFRALGGEVVVDYALRLRREAGENVWVFGYSNDVMAYIPSRRVLHEGGYEASGAMMFSLIHPGPWADDTEDRIIGAVRKLDNALKNPR